jgi:hypothetical protein
MIHNVRFISVKQVSGIPKIGVSTTWLCTVALAQQQS